jgi:hypothetical protein
MPTRLVRNQPTAGNRRSRIPPSQTDWHLQLNQTGAKAMNGLIMVAGQLNQLDFNSSVENSVQTSCLAQRGLLTIG